MASFSSTSERCANAFFESLIFRYSSFMMWKNRATYNHATLNPIYPQDQTATAKPTALNPLVIVLNKEKPSVALLFDTAADNAVCFLGVDIFQVQCTGSWNAKYLKPIHAKTALFQFYIICLLQIQEHDKDVTLCVVTGWTVMCWRPFTGRWCLPGSSMLLVPGGALQPHQIRVRLKHTYDARFGSISNKTPTSLCHNLLMTFFFENILGKPQHVLHHLLPRWTHHSANMTILWQLSLMPETSLRDMY